MHFGQADLNLYKNADAAEDPAVRKRLQETRAEIQVRSGTPLFDPNPIVRCLVSLAAAWWGCRDRHRYPW